MGERNGWEKGTVLISQHNKTKEEAKMDNILSIFVFLVSIIVIARIINEKTLKISNNIALLISSFCISIAFLWAIKQNIINSDFFIFSTINKLSIDKLLLEGVLCFMLFAGSSKLQFTKFVNNFKSIATLSLLTTVINSILYGAIFYGISQLINLPLNFLTCLLLGCIVSPTDPIAATSILNKLGLPKGVSSVIEGESLFNDGIGVALFIFVKNIIANVNNENFILLVSKSLFGSIIIGFIISFLLFKLTKQTKDPHMHIIISLLDVSLSYVICEYLGCSGVIASVVCGLYFSYQNKKCERWKIVVDSNNLYLDFWNIIDELLNNILFVLIGLTACIIPINEKILIIIPMAIIVNFISRYISVFTTCGILKEKNIPNKYNTRDFSKLMTFSALRGGLSLAMAISAATILADAEYNIVLNTTMITILFTTIIQGLLIPRVYKKIENRKNTKSLINIQ